MLVAAVLAGAAGLAWVRSTPVVADAVTLHGSWYNAASVSPPATPAPVIGGVNAPAPDVPAGDFPVAVTAGQSAKETFLHIDTTAIPTGSQVSSYVLTLTEDSGASGNLNMAGAAGKLAVAPVKDYWSDGAAGAPYSVRPGVASSPVVTPQRQSTGAWTVDLTPIVAAWVAGTTPNNGIAIQPVTTTAPTDNFEVVWSASTATVASQTSPAVTSTVAGPADTTVTPDTTPSAPAAGTDQSLGGGSPALTPPTPVEAAPVAPSTVPPAAAPPLPPALIARKVRSHRSPPAGFYLAVLVVLALGGACAVGLGEAGEPARSRQGSVMRALARHAQADPQEDSGP